MRYPVDDTFIYRYNHLPNSPRDIVQCGSVVRHPLAHYAHLPRVDQSQTLLRGIFLDETLCGKCWCHIVLGGKSLCFSRQYPGAGENPGPKVIAVVTADESVFQLPYSIECGFGGFLYSFKRRRKARLNLAKCAHAGGFPWDIRTCFVAAVGGHLDVFELLQSTSCP